MPFVLNQLAPGTSYSAANTLNCSGSARVNIHVSVQPIFFKLWIRPPDGIGAASEGPEIYRLPGLYGMDRQVDQVAVRAAVAGALVTIDAWTDYELGPGGPSGGEQLPGTQAGPGPYG